jgi:hypothetical protein
MAINTLFRTGEESPWVYRGHDTEALGPSDSSDTGSDMQGVGGAVEAAELGLDPSLVDKSVSNRAGARRDARDARDDARSETYTQDSDPSLDETVINYPKKK